MRDHLNDLINDMRNFGEGNPPAPPIMAKDMTLRDRFAASVISDLVMDYGWEPAALDVLAFRAYLVADAMLRERDK